MDFRGGRTSPEKRRVTAGTWRSRSRECPAAGRVRRCDSAPASAEPSRPPCRKCHKIAAHRAACSRNDRKTYNHLRILGKIVPTFNDASIRRNSGGHNTAAPPSAPEHTVDASSTPSAKPSAAQLGTSNPERTYTPDPDRAAEHTRKPVAAARTRKPGP